MTEGAGGGTRRVIRRAISNEAISQHTADERLILRGMVVSAEVLREVEQHLKVLKRTGDESASTRAGGEALFDNSTAARLAGWCLEYWAQYGEPPRRHVRDLIANALQQGECSADEAGMLEDAAAGALDDCERAERFNAAYARDAVTRYCRRRALDLMTSGIAAALTRGDVDEGEARVAAYVRPLSAEERRGLSLASITPERTREAFTTAAEPLFVFRGAMGRLLNKQMVRGGFVGFMGAMKRGKTWLMGEIALRAGMARCNVVWFDSGDMTEDDILRRLGVRLTGRSDDPRFCGELFLPTLDCSENQRDTCRHEHRTCRCGVVGADAPPTPDGAPALSPEERVSAAPREYTPCTHCEYEHPVMFRGAVWWAARPSIRPLTWREAQSAYEALVRRMRGRDFKIECAPSDTLSVHDADTRLTLWEHTEGFIPDVVIFDGADNLAPQPEHQRLDFRHQQNGIWKAMRRMSQQRHCLVIASTQVDAEGQEAATLKRRNFSEDIRKYAHVTAMAALNQTEEEQLLGLLRVGWLLGRNGEFIPSVQAKVLQHLKCGRPVVASYF